MFSSLLRMVLPLVTKKYHFYDMVRIAEEHRCFEDFDAAHPSTMAVDFCRQWYHTRTKHPQISLESFQEDYRSNHNGKEWEQEDDSVYLMVDDDTDTNALPKTNNIKTIITAEGPIDLERKGQQSYQGKLYTRFLCFGNGELTAANDRSNGFYRRQMVLYAKAPAPDRVDDPYLADKLFQELPGIFNWCFEGLLRLLKNNFQFTVSQHMLDNMREIKANTDSITAFLESSGYISFETDAMSSSKDIYKVYQQFCADNLYCPAASSTLSSVLKNQKAKYRVEPTSNIYLPAANSSVKKRVRGFKGIRLLDQTD